MAKKFKVVFYQRSDFVSRDGKVPILIRLYLERDRITLGSTGCSAPKELWDSRTGRVEGKSALAKYTNNELQRIETDLNYIFRRLEFSEDLSLETIRAQYLGVKTEDDCESFTEFEQLYLEKIKGDIGTRICKKAYSRYVNSITHFDNYIKSKYNKAQLKMKELTPSVIDGFVQYLFQTLDLGHNTIMKKVQNIKTIIEYARKKGLLSIDPFIDFKFQFKETERKFLSEEEVNAIMSKNFSNGRLEFVRDMFIFSCFTGLAYIDLFQLTSENLKMIGDNLWIMTHRKKTDVPSRILLLDVPKKIIAKYGDKASEGKLFPNMSNQKINEYLKEIAAVCNINHNLTFHMSRHTFATLMLTKGVSIESVSKMLGHTKIRTTEIYAKITNKKIEKDMLNVASQLSEFNLEGVEKKPSKRNSEKIVKPIQLKDKSKAQQKRTKSTKKEAYAKRPTEQSNKEHNDKREVTKSVSSHTVNTKNKTKSPKTTKKTKENTSKKGDRA